MTAPVVESRAPLALEADEKRRLDALDPFVVAVGLVEAGRVMESGPYWRRAIAAAPRDGQRWYAWGATLGQVGKYAEAERALWGAIGLGYDESPVWEALGVVYVRLRCLVEAEQAYEKAVEKSPRNVASVIALGNAKFAVGDHLGGRRFLERAVSVGARAGSPDAANVAQTRLWMGQWRLGWQAYEHRREMSEWRASNKELPSMPHGPIGVHRGAWYRKAEHGYAPLDARAIVVSAEQGQGDAVQFARFLTAAAERAPIWFRAHSALVPMMRGAFQGNDRIRVLDKGDTIAPEDVQGWMPLMSLPYFLGVSHPRDVPEPIRPFGKTWNRVTGGRPLIYVHEQGNTAHAYDWDRSAPVGTLTEMVRQSGATVATYWDGDTWEHTVNLMLTCDRVVTVDTGLAHVAASLGVPTDIFVPTLPEWRWGCKRDTTSPWYPSATLWWRERSDGWADVCQRWTEANR